jgi:L-aminopeptidase/D-esterase-like protein
MRGLPRRPMSRFSMRERLARPLSVNDDICDVPGILVGHDTQTGPSTGCTVLVCERPARGAVDVRGGGPGTRETDLLDPSCTMQEVHAIVLTGGSAFGLDAATGVMAALDERGVGFDTGVARVPIVPAAVIFDLAFGDSKVRPDAAAGRRAFAAATGGPVALGSVGAGTGATVGKLSGQANAMKGGVGSASATLTDGHMIGALVVVNAIGDVFDPATGQRVAGARGAPLIRTTPLPAPGTNTTLAVIATNAPFSKADLRRIAMMAHDGLAMAIRPVHTPMDGDVVFTLSTADAGEPLPAGPLATFLLGMAGAEAARVLSAAVLKAVRTARGSHGIPGLGDEPGGLD